jgi:transposase
MYLCGRKQFGASSEKYADGYTQLSLFNGAEPDAPESDLEESHPFSYKRKKRSGKKEEDLSSFETTEVIEYKLTGAGRYCPDCNTKYNGTFS